MVEIQPILTQTMRTGYQMKDEVYATILVKLNFLRVLPNCARAHKCLGSDRAGCTRVDHPTVKIEYRAA